MVLVEQVFELPRRMHIRLACLLSIWRICLGLFVVHGLLVSFCLQLEMRGIDSDTVWMFGSDWPNNGEIDIIEGVNSQNSNLISLHSLVILEMCQNKQITNFHQQCKLLHIWPRRDRLPPRHELRRRLQHRWLQRSRPKHSFLWHWLQQQWWRRIRNRMDLILHQNMVLPSRFHPERYLERHA